jgi:hypothetical protein
MGDKLWDLLGNRLAPGSFGAGSLWEWRQLAGPGACWRSLTLLVRLLISRFSVRFRVGPFTSAARLLAREHNGATLGQGAGPRLLVYLQRPHRCGGTILDPKFLEDVLHMLFHCARAHARDRPDFGVRLALREPGEHLGFASCETKLL